jgi:hypothetical protein
MKIEVISEAVGKEAGLEAIKSSIDLLESMMIDYDNDDYITSSRGRHGNGWMVVVSLSSDYEPQ